MSTPFTAINDIQMLEWELQSIRQRFNTGPQFSFWKWCKLVKQRLDESWVYQLE